MAKTTVFDSDLLKLIFQNIGIANIADQAVTANLTNLYVSLHTDVVPVGGSQTTNETAYPPYVRFQIARSAGAWTVTGNSVSPAAQMQFVTSTGGPSVITQFAVGTASSGAGKVLYTGAVTPSITVNAGTTPILTAATAITES